ncbi:hypothetical protein RHECNPAF_890042 [Rhizobium etli CNPAF512]|nr:hypothetical protein RHECNPAF_890042 [Rhizobium etli CNPAF512]
MGMVGAGVDAQVLHLATAERATRNHAFDGLFEDALRKAAFDDLARGALLDAAGVTGVPVVDLVGILLAGENDLVGIDDDDVVAVVNMGGEGCLVLAAQAHSDDGSETANDQPFGVDDHPLLLHLCRLLGEGSHSEYSLLGPLPEGLKGRFLLLGLAGARHAKKKAAGKAAFWRGV